ncbi:hypothetical protein [Nannocystis radixulma]|uniref:Glycine zipper family protein n=1 Tax=Nannocystis radixulma TaxID=2995305 RepID=A0ABT5AWT7_9BACT|nr:hypothetical protein [Nannocystis radixulma]MDC0666309.1 hypothetical protein [Nannocystis radixulma]
MLVGSILTLSLSFSPVSHAQGSEWLANAECAAGEVGSVFLPGGGEVETSITASSMRMNFYLDGERVLTVSENDGRVEADVTGYGLALEPERAAEFRDEVVSHAQAIMNSSRACSDSLRSKVDENLKCNLIGSGAAILGGIAGTTLGGGLGGVLGAGAGASIGHLCNWLVNKVCEENAEGC